MKPPEKDPGRHGELELRRRRLDEMTPPNKEGRLTSKRSAAIQRGAEKMFSEARLAMIDGLQTRPGRRKRSSAR